MKKKIVFVALSILCITSVVAADSGFWAQCTFLKGEVYVKTRSTPVELPLKLGMVLLEKDSVRVGESSRVSFLLNSGGFLVVPAGKTTILSNSANQDKPRIQEIAGNLTKTLLAKEGKNPMLKHIGGLRGAEEGLVQTPNNTKVNFQDPTTFVWGTDPQVAKFRFTLMGPKDFYLEESVAGTTYRLPAGKLIPAATYYWEIGDDSRRDAVEALSSGSFQTIDQGTATTINRQTAELARAFSPAERAEDTTALFLTFQLYRANEMQFDALLVLEKLLHQDDQNKELILWRDDLCRIMNIAPGDVAGIIHMLGP